MLQFQNALYIKTLAFFFVEKNVKVSQQKVLAHLI